ncbi:MAG: Trm112 family protein [Candidatus Fibromonas sp.]|jgi:uncharacterized protein YbaR (Trm112 family)|nr:Trm112 family protein [Candidatus Fibromonas sp.]
MISKDLLEILCCPITKQPLQEANAEELEKLKLEAALITADKKRAYPIRQNIPVLLAEECVLIDELRVES